MWRLSTAAVLALITVQSANAREFDEKRFKARMAEAEASCSFFHDRVFEAPENVKLAKTVIESPLYDGSHLSECADKKISNCRVRKTIGAYNSVVVIKQEGSFSCVMPALEGYFGAGWISNDNLKIIEPYPIDTKKWIGDWEGPASVSIKPESNKALKITGKAIWQGINSVHFGELNFEAVPENNKVLSAASDKYSCSVLMLLYENRLIVIDRQCGGTNVTFTGVYSRKVK